LIITEKAIEPLIAALEDRDASVRREAVRALGNRQALPAGGLARGIVALGILGDMGII
jgi:HEAT repeat protein